MVARSQVEVPSYVPGEFEVYVNGVRQQPGVDFRQLGRTLVFDREVRGEGQLSFWRWLSLFLGVAGTYRKNDTVDLVYQGPTGRTVATLQPTAVVGDDDPRA
jgi:hypothetical protein